MASITDGIQVLDQGVGYGIVVGKSRYPHPAAIAKLYQRCWCFLRIAHVSHFMMSYSPYQLLCSSNFLRLSITYVQNRYTAYSTKQAEEFNTASRSVKPGLIASGIVSSWTWSATLLTSCTFAYSYGICGPMWYAAMGTWQVLLFALIAIKIKATTPGAHTFPEIILSRHGRVAHITYLFL